MPADLATRLARTGSSRTRCSPSVWIHVVDEIAARLDRDISYRRREAVVRHLAARSQWYIRWARTHHPGSHATSRAYAITWLWTTWASGLLTTSPAWPTPPDHATRAYYRRYVTRLTPAARIALTEIGAARLKETQR